MVHHCLLLKGYFLEWLITLWEKYPIYSDLNFHNIIVETCNWVLRHVNRQTQILFFIFLNLLLDISLKMVDLLHKILILIQPFFKELFLFLILVYRSTNLCLEFLSFQLLHAFCFYSYFSLESFFHFFQ